MKTLHLNLKRKWFDMILSGEKPEEYREIKPYWYNKFINDFVGDPSIVMTYPIGEKLFKHFDTITFSNGYAKNRDQFEIYCKGIEIKEGNPKWGAKKGNKYFVLGLGALLNAYEWCMCSECGRFNKIESCKKCYPFVVKSDWKTKQKENFCRNIECPFYKGWSYGCKQNSDASKCAARIRV